MSRALAKAPGSRLDETEDKLEESRRSLTVRLSAQGSRDVCSCNLVLAVCNSAIMSFGA